MEATNWMNQIKRPISLLGLKLYSHFLRHIKIWIPSPTKTFEIHRRNFSCSALAFASLLKFIIPFKRKESFFECALACAVMVSVFTRFSFLFFSLLFLGGVGADTPMIMPT